MKIKGAEWNAFYNDNTYWADGVWFDYITLIVDGVEVCDADIDIVDPMSTVEIFDGVVYFDEDQITCLNFVQFFKNWRKEQKVKTICVEIPNELFDAVCDSLKQQGCKIIKNK